VSDVLLASTLFLWQPINEITLFNLNYHPVDKVFLVLCLLGNLLFLSTMPFFIDTDLFGWKRMFHALNNDTFPYPFPTKIYVPWIYSTCRHPMQAGILGVVIFANANYTLGRALVVGILVIGDVIGILQEEKYLSTFPAYREYCKTVTNRYIPNLFNLFSDNRLTNGKDDKKDE
jgi:protein-S-isoprenylcysteine O-methyltransferase Ste14